MQVLRTTLSFTVVSIPFFLVSLITFRRLLIFFMLKPKLAASFRGNEKTIYMCGVLAHGSQSHPHCLMNAGPGAVEVGRHILCRGLSAPR